MKKIFMTFLSLTLFLNFAISQNSENFSSKNYSSPKDVAVENPFFDNFDDGDVTDYNVINASLTIEASTTHKFGTHSLHIDGGSYSGISRTLDFWPTYICGYVMTPTTLTGGAATYIRLNSISNANVFTSAIDDVEGPSIWDISANGWSGLGSQTGGTWYFVEMKINYDAQTVDYIVNNIFIETVPFQGAISGTQCKIDFYNINGLEGYWDDIYAYGELKTPVASDTNEICPNSILNLTANGSGQENLWYADDQFIGQNDISVNIGTNDTSFRVNSQAKMGLTLSGQTDTYSGQTRGYYFQAPKDFTITDLWVEGDTTQSQTIEVVRFTAQPPEYSNTTNDFASLGFWYAYNATQLIPCDIDVSQGDWIGIYGVRNGINSYNSGIYKAHISNINLDLHRSGMQDELTSSNQMHDIWGAATGSQLSRVKFYILEESDFDTVNVSIETEIPVITCPSDTTVDADSSHTFTVNGNFLNAIATDNCDIDYFTNDFNNLDSLNNAVLNQGITPINWTVYDIAGNHKSCSFDVTVNNFVGLNNIISNIEVFPNPSNGLFNISNVEGYNIQITDVSGKIINLFSNIDINTLNIDMTDNKTGIYFVKIYNSTESKTMKIIIN